MLRASTVLLLATLVLSGSTTSAGVDWGGEPDAVPLDDIANGSASTPWSWPISEPHPIVRPYISPETPYSAGHRGIDIGASFDVELRAPTAGIVHFAGIVVDRPVLSIRHPGGLITSYEPVTTALTRGDLVSQGEIIGEVQEGHCLRPCLHFGVRLDGEYVSPLNYLSGTPRAILLPTRGPLLPSTALTANG